MLASRTWRLLAIVAATALLTAGTCNRNDDDANETTEPTTEPERTPELDAVADFQLVGLIDEAFAGQAPPLEIPSGGFEGASPSPAASPGGTPAGTPVGTTPTRGGIIRLTIEDLSDDLREACGMAEDDVVHVYWTTETAFEPGDVLDDVEDEIEDDTAGVVGTVYRTSGSTFDTSTATPDTTPAETPDGTAAATGSPSAEVQASDCLLVAEQIGFTQTTLPTPRAVTRRTAAPTPARTATATPKKTASPTPKPATATPDDTDPPSPTATSS